MNLNQKFTDEFVKVLHFVRNNNGKEYIGNFHSHDYFECILIHSAEGISQMIDFEDYTCQTGDMFFLHPNQIHKFNAKPDATHKMTVLKVKSDYLTQVVAINNTYLALINLAFYYNNKIKIENENVPKIVEIVHQIEVEITSSKKYNSLMVTNLLSVLIILIIRNNESTIDFPKNDIVKNFMRLLDEMYHQDLTIENIAEKLNVSTRQLHRVISARTNMSPKKHKDNRLSLQAKRMLYGSNKVIKEIAFELGFGDVSNFTKFFIKQNALSPTAFRKCMSEKYH